MDAAILFADILLIPIGLGRRVEFVKGVGPTLDPIDVDGIDALTVEGAADRVSAVYETVSQGAGGTGRETPGHGADRLCRRAVDGRDLYAGRAREPD